MLRLSIKARIEDFDAFFKRNFVDYRAPIFEKQKFRLRKLLSEDGDERRGNRGELDIRFAIDDSINVARHNALRQERPKTPARTVTVRSAKRVTPVKEESHKSPLKKPNALVKIKMTKEEYEEYMRQAQNQAPQFAKPQNQGSSKLPAFPQPNASRSKSPLRPVAKSPVRLMGVRK